MFNRAKVRKWAMLSADRLGFAEIQALMEPISDSDLREAKIAYGLMHVVERKSALLAAKLIKSGDFKSINEKQKDLIRYNGEIFDHIQPPPN